MHPDVPLSGPVSREYLWYIPNTVLSGHRGDDTVDGWGSLEYSAELAQRAEQHGWGGALLGTSWGRPDTFTVGTALAARTTKFKPLIAIRPGYWRPANFALHSESAVRLASLFTAFSATSAHSSKSDGPRDHHCAFACEHESTAQPIIAAIKTVRVRDKLKPTSCSQLEKQSYYRLSPLPVAESTP